MSRSTLYAILCAAILFYFLQFISAQNYETDRLALLDIKAKIIKDPLGIMNSWNDTIDFCEWHGVTCGRRDRRVAGLNLGSLALKGSISPYIGNLSFLRELHLQNNSLTGIIPKEIGRLHRLQYLDLYNNLIGGEIPTNISRCSSLVSLDFYSNRLVGGIPPEIGLLTHLQGLWLSSNNLSGTIPSSVGNLSSLTRLALTYNNLFGRIPDSLGNLRNLTYLTLGVNKLSGPVPLSIFNLSFMTIFSLGVNHLEGRLPTNLGLTFPNVTFFNIASNQFTGVIPPSISNFSNIESLSLGANNLHGEVPSLGKLEKLGELRIFENFLGPSMKFLSSLANATMLNSLQIGDNNFTGTFPEIICNFSRLSKLVIDDIMLSGPIPMCIGDLVDLTVFSAPRTNLSGVIPSSMTKLQNLDTLKLQNNHLTGHVPSSIGNLTKLTVLQLSQNYIGGIIPSTLGNCRNLLAVDLSLNNLSGRIPLELFRLPTLSIFLDLSDNHFTGILPTEVGQLENLGILDISDNMLSGEIPSALGKCISLEYLYMERNSFRGTIPSALMSLKGLQEFNLSWNNLSGGIPGFLANFPLQVLNLSYNNLEGEVPTGGIFSNKSGFSILGNSMLCGGIPELKLPLCNISESHRRSGGRRMRLLITIFSVIAGVTLLVVFVSVSTLCYRKRRKEPTASTDSGNSVANLSYQRLLKATNGFSSENLIGSGTYGVVYKGTLDQDGTMVAVKVFKLHQHGASKSFLAECGVLKNTRHRNLVKVITACSGVDFQGNAYKALVYEYIENGSLDSWLHSEPTSRVDGTSCAQRNLDIFQRLDIAVDVAFALEYLHHHCGATIVHCDIKPSNVLLDSEMVAHIGDFGLAKFLSNAIIGTHGNQSSSVGVRGTIGHAPPEYGLGNEVSTYGDVYSFGILILEIFTCKRPTDDMFKVGLSLHSYVKAALAEQAIEILDPALLEDTDGNETGSKGPGKFKITNTNKSVILDTLTSVLEVALCCSAELPQQRLDIMVVAAKLSSIRNNFLAVLQAHKSDFLISL